jgi:hypothetical protein
VTRLLAPWPGLHEKGVMARKTAPKKAPADRSGALIGTWGPGDEADSNVHFTVARRGRGLAVTARDIYDGEQLTVRRTTWDGGALRFETVTPSTGSAMAHELEPTSATTARYRFTVTQTWKKLG